MDLGCSSRNNLQHFFQQKYRFRTQVEGLHTVFSGLIDDRAAQQQALRRARMDTW
jgi:hypothetical protein